MKTEGRQMAVGGKQSRAHGLYTLCDFRRTARLAGTAHRVSALLDRGLFISQMCDFDAMAENSLQGKGGSIE